MKYLLLILAMLFFGCGTPNEIDINMSTPNDILDAFETSSELTYIAEQGKEDYWQTPAETRRRGSGDCEDFALYCQDALRNRGIVSELVVGYTKPGSDELHAWVEVKDGGKTLIIDPTAKRIVMRSSEYIYIAIYGCPSIYNRINKYKSRSGVKHINTRYDSDFIYSVDKIWDHNHEH